MQAGAGCRGFSTWKLLNMNIVVGSIKFTLFAFKV